MVHVALMRFTPSPIFHFWGCIVGVATQHCIPFRFHEPGPLAVTHCFEQDDPWTKLPRQAHQKADSG